MPKLVCNLSQLPKAIGQRWLSKFDAVISDADGVIWHFQDPVPGSVETLNALKAAGKRVFICTNNSKLSHGDMFKKVEGFGINITPNELLTAPRTVARYLQKLKFNKMAYVIGRQSLVDELTAVGIKNLPIGPDPITETMEEYAKGLKLEKNVGAVIVGNDDYLSVPKIIKAASYLLDPECLFLVTSRGGGFPLKKRALLPGTGTVVAAIKACAYRKPLTLGKPNPKICSEIIDCGLIKPETTIMLGDNMYTDMAFGNNCGFFPILVGTGINKLEDIIKIAKSDLHLKDRMMPQAFLEKLGDLCNFLPD